MNEASRHTTAVRDQIPWVQLIAYGLGGFVPIALFNSVGQLSGLIVNVGLGISAILVGVAQMAPRLWDAVTDPLMGHISDNTRSRWGRRRPYILIGGFAVAISFVAMWMVPRDWSVAGQFWYFLLMSLVFYTAVTVFEIPHGALGMEMTGDYHERTKLFSVKSFVGNAGAMITPWFYALANRDFFKQGGDEVDGMQRVAFIAAGIVIALSVACAMLCRERQFEHARAQRRTSLWQSLRATMRNKTFLILVGIIFATVMGFNLVKPLKKLVCSSGVRESTAS
ncbi:MAG: MFS transporter, partial [Planctomycetota bacterium]